MTARRARSRQKRPAGPSHAAQSHAETWLAAHRRLLLAIIVTASAIVRIVYFVQLNGTPLINLDRWDQGDMHYYDAWARQIAGGDWRSAGVRVPMHQWQMDVADHDFVSHPSDRAGGAVRPESTSAATAAISAEEIAWSRWMHVPRFYEDPLYPYLIAATYRLWGPDVRHVFVWQLALGILSNLLLWTLARRAFGEIAGAIAAALAVLYAPLVYYELFLLRESLIIFVGLAVVWLTDRAVSSGGWWRFALLGLTLGLAFLLKSSLVLLGGIVVVAMVARWRGGWRRAVAPAGALVAGLAVALTPLVVRNVSLGVPPLSLASSGPLTFVVSNVSSFAPEAGFVVDTPAVAAFLGDTDGGWFAAAKFVSQSHTIGTYADLAWDKWDWLWRWFEMPNNENFYYMRLQVPLLSWLPVTFWISAPLAIVGLVLGLRRRPEAWLLYGLVAASMAPLMIFYELGRLRTPLAAALLPFAALTIERLITRVRTARYGAACALVLSVVAVGSWTDRPLSSGDVFIRTDYWLMPYAVSYDAEIERALDRHDLARAAAAYLAYFKSEPSADQILKSNDPDLPRTLARMHVLCANLLRDSGQTAAEATERARATQLLALDGR